MRVLNIHFRDFPRSPAVVGGLIDTLASDNDQLWPGENWPPMRFPGGLRVRALRWVLRRRTAKRD
jgi:hypothetical protein